MNPSVITFRPDNFLTVGLIAAVVYVAAVLLAQLLMRAGVIGGAPAAAAGPSAGVASA
jgi:hypothetical protein